MSSETLIVLLMFAAFLIALFMGASLSWVLGGLAIIFGYMFWGNGSLSSLISLMVRNVNRSATTTSYVCTPMFILMGAVLEKSGVSERLFESIHILMGKVRGGMAVATVLICAMMGAATGIIGSSVTIMGMMALPAMLKCGYDKKLASGTVMAAGCLGSLIPPSVILIVYSSLSNISIAKLFSGGLCAGLVLSAIYAVYIIIRCIINPNIGPAMSEEELKKHDLKKITGIFLISFLPTIVLIIAVLGSIMLGVATPNEASAVGAFGAIILSIIYKKFSWGMLREACFNTVKTTAMVIWVIMAANMFTSVFMGLGGDKAVSDLVMTMGAGTKWGSFVVVLILIAIMGCLIDSTGILLIGIPLFTPIIYAFGFDPLWFALIFSTMIQMSFLSPPFAYAIFYLKNVAPPEVTTRDLYGASVPFICAQVLAIVLFCIFPGLITYLPGMLYGR